MTIITKIQAEELMTRTNIAINCQFKWLSFDKKQDLASIVFTKTCNYMPSVKHPDPVPCVEFLKKVARRQARKAKNYILVTGQRRAEKDEAELEAIRAELNLDGEESRYADKYREVSYESYNEATGWEPSCQSIEAQIIERSDETLMESHIEAYKNSPVFPAMLKAALAHVAAGGTFKSFAEKMGLSAQTLMNRFQKIVQKTNNANAPLLPNISFDIQIKQTTSKPHTKQVKRSNAHDQYSLQF